MHPLIENNRAAITALCRQYGVRKLDVFGSILSDDFDPSRSDVDVVAEFDPVPLGRSFDRYLDFKTELEELFGRSVDVVEMKALHNRRLRHYIERTKAPLYAAT